MALLGSLRFRSSPLCCRDFFRARKVELSESVSGISTLRQSRAVSGRRADDDVGSIHAMGLMALKAGARLH